MQDSQCVDDILQQGRYEGRFRMKRKLLKGEGSVSQIVTKDHWHQDHLESLIFKKVF